MELSGFRVSIRSGDQRLKEHSIEVSPDGKKAACWVPSESGKEFVVEFKVKRSSIIKDKAKSVHVCVDGRNIRKYPLLPHDARAKVGGVRTSGNTIRPLLFADVRTTDEDRLFDDIRVNSDEIGSIRVQVYLVESWQRSNGSSEKYIMQDHPPAVISERAKKLVGHCVSLGDEKPDKIGSHYYSLEYDDQKPDLEFEFRYRSVAMLQALGIILLAKREAPPIIDIEDEDILPPPKRQKFERDEDLMRSVQAELDRLRQRNRELEEKIAGPSGVKKEVVKCDPADIIDLT